MTTAEVVALDAGAATADDESPEWWRDRLLRRLFAQSADQENRVRWYLGQQQVPEVGKDFKLAYRQLLDMSRNAWVRLLIDAIAERTNVIGIRNDGTDADLDIWRLLKGSHFDVDQRLVHSEALTLRTSYFSIWDGDDSESVKISAESALQVLHEAEPSDPRKLRAVVKIWEDDARSKFYCNLYLPGSTTSWSAPKPTAWTSTGSSISTYVSTIAWSELEDSPTSNPYGFIPFVHVVNRPTLFAGPQSEIDDLVPVLKRIDKLTLDFLVTAHAGSFRQKWATGMKVPVDPVTQKPVEPFEAAVARVWVSPSKETSFGSFDLSPLDPYLKGRDAEVAQLSAISRVPSYYLVSPNLVNPPSAETMNAAEAGLIKKAEALMRVWGEAYEALARMALTIVGDDRDTASLSIVWGDPSLPSEAKQADAAVKWATLGVPQEALWERGGATPEEIARWKSMAATAKVEERVLDSIGQPTPTQPVETTELEATATEPPAESDGPEAFV